MIVEYDYLDPTRVTRMALLHLFQVDLPIRERKSHLRNMRNYTDDLIQTLENEHD